MDFGERWSPPEFRYEIWVTGARFPRSNYGPSGVQSEHPSSAISDGGWDRTIVSTRYGAMVTETQNEKTANSEVLSAIDALHSTPARRYLSARPIPEDVLWAVLDAAIRGPSGGNRQTWGWIVVTDPEIKAPIAEWYRETFEQSYGLRREEIFNAPPSDVGLSPSGYRAVEHLALHIAEAPVWVIPVLRNAADSENPRLGSNIYGAVQQLLLAARTFGIGGVLTTFHSRHEDEIRALLGLPDDALTMALVPLGYPERGRWSEPTRPPVENVVHWNRWGDTHVRG
jgi:nitroreductase